jgi:thiamine biosynthesis protein ThiS
MVKIGDQTIQWQPGMTLAQVMDSLEDGHLFAVVRLNGKLVSKPDFASTQIPEEAQIIPLPLIAGG